MFAKESTRYPNFDIESNENHSRFTVIKVLAATSLLLVSTSCFDNNPSSSRSEPAFHQPPTAEYHLNDNDQYYDQLRATREIARDPESAKAIEQLYDIPVAQWLNSSIEDADRLINENVSKSRPEGSIPIFVAYNIPNRDLGGEAGGGLPASSEYRNWIESVSGAIGDAPSIVILEPDALAGVPQLKSDQERIERISLLRYALKIFQTNNSKTAVYLDAGNSQWLDTVSIVRLLRQVDSDGKLVGGIALNVAGHYSDKQTRAYATAIMKTLGRPLHVMIDSSMNGAPNTDQLAGWCNVKGEHIGVADTHYSPDLQFEEAFIKTPGESDGRCGESAKPAGEFDSELLLDQVS